MKTIIQCLSALCCCVTAIGAPTQVVVPNNLANVEGNSSVAAPFNSTSFRFQQVFDASQFAIPAGMSGRVDKISFRLDGASTETVALFFGGSSVQLSTVQRGPDGLSPIFADNRGLDSATIWNGSLGIGGLAQPGAMPQPWPFAESIPTFGGTPFFYDPRMGNLLLEVAAGDGQAFLPGALDGHSATGDSISWVFANSAGASSGTAQTLGLVTRFDITVVPEPASFLLLLAGLTTLAFARRRGK
jgi:hypothetical protein